MKQKLLCAFLFLLHFSLLIVSTEPKPPPALEQGNKKNKDAIDKVRMKYSHSLRHWDKFLERHQDLYLEYDRTIDEYRTKEQERLTQLFELIKTDQAKVQDYCANNSQDDCRDYTQEVYQKHLDQAEDIALQLAQATTNSTERLMQELITMESESSELMHNFHWIMQECTRLERDDPVLAQHDCGEKKIRVKKKQQNCGRLRQDIGMDIVAIRNILIANLCFELDGVMEKDVNATKQTKFENAVEVVVEDILGDEGMLVDVLYVETLNTQFVKQQQQHDRWLSFFQYFQDLSAVVTAQIRVVVAIQCRCGDEDPISDVFSDRRRRQLLNDHASSAETQDLTTRMLISTNGQEKMEELLHEYVTVIFGQNVTVDVVPCGAIDFEHGYTNNTSTRRN